MFIRSERSRFPLYQNRRDCNVSIVEAAQAGRAQTVSVPQSISRVAVAVVSAYIAAQMIADIASIKIGVVGLPLAGALAVDMGTFI